VKKTGARAIGRRRVLKAAALVGVAALTPARAADAQTQPKATAPDPTIKMTPMTDELSADEIRKLLQLEPNATCGFVRLTFLSKQSIAAGGLPAPFADGRPSGSALYFMVTSGAPVRLHRIRNDQLYHYYLGDPIELLLLHADGGTDRIMVGPDLRNGQRLQQFIPGNTFHTARLIGRRRWFLGASTEWPGVVPADVEIGNLDEFATRFPSAAADLREIAVSVRHVAPAGADPG
jgi:predicted cupin superfamily sugar epimerase